MKKSLSIVFVLIPIAVFISFVACKKSSTTPRLTTTAVTPISDTIVLSGGEILNDGGAVVISKGVCWDTIINPSVSLVTKTSDAGGPIFTSVVSGLKSNKTYYIRAYATNRVGVSYGNQITYVTPADPIDSIVGTYHGVINYSTRYDNYLYPSENRRFDTTYNFTFIVSKACSDTFKTNTTYSTCLFSEYAGHWNFVYNPTNSYRVLYYNCTTYFGNSNGDLKFYPGLDSVWYHVVNVNASGGYMGSSYSCGETFSGKK